jgi:RNA polymerase sigma-70 factor (sigma-E family)
MAGWPEEQFAAFVAARLPALVAFGFSLTGDLGHSQDLVQTALLSVYVRSRRQVPEAPEAYVRRAVLNAFLSGKRRRRVNEELVEAVPDTSQLTAVPVIEQQEALLQLLADLTPRQRAVLVLRYLEDWSEAQIADALGMSISAVKKQASRGMAALREQAGRTKEAQP